MLLFTTWSAAVPDGLHAQEEVVAHLEGQVLLDESPLPEGRVVLHLVGPEEGGAMAAALIEAGYDKTFLLATMGIFLLILLIGYLYAWRKGVLRWS